MKKEIHNGIEYHFPSSFESVSEYLASETEFPMSKTAENDIKWESVRITRSQLIASTDWTQTLDCQLSESKKAEFVSYRQALRDIPQTYSNPDDVIWPEKPVV
ncbi:TPA: tail fiber assembly protein [Vibrio parahaemolyticus]